MYFQNKLTVYGQGSNVLSLNWCQRKFPLLKLCVLFLSMKGQREKKQDLKERWGM